MDSISGSCHFITEIILSMTCVVHIMIVQLHECDSSYSLQSMLTSHAHLMNKHRRAADGVDLLESLEAKRVDAPRDDAMQDICS